MTTVIVVDHATEKFRYDTRRGLLLYNREALEAVVQGLELAYDKALTLAGRRESKPRESGYLELMNQVTTLAGDVSVLESDQSTCIKLLKELTAEVTDLSCRSPSPVQLASRIADLSREQATDRKLTGSQDIQLEEIRNQAHVDREYLNKVGAMATSSATVGDAALIHAERLAQRVSILESGATGLAEGLKTVTTAGSKLRDMVLGHESRLRVRKDAHESVCSRLAELTEEVSKLKPPRYRG